MKKIFNWIKNECYETKVLLRSIPAVLMTFFVLSLVMMNLLANKSLALNLSWLALDAGIVVSWLAFLVMDILVKHFGPKAATRLTVVALVINLVVSMIFYFGSLVPGFWGESFVEVGGDAINTALDRTVGGTWYVLLGSTFAFLVSSIFNNSVNWAVGKAFKKNPDGAIAYFTRSWISTALAQFVDNFVFALIISLNFFGWSLLQCFTCALTGAIVELLFEMLFSPIGYRISKKWKEHNIGKEYLDLAKQRQTVADSRDTETN